MIIDGNQLILYRMVYLLYSGFAPKRWTHIWHKGAERVYVGLGDAEDASL